MHFLGLLLEFLAFFVLVVEVDGAPKIFSCPVCSFSGNSFADAKGKCDQKPQFQACPVDMMNPVCAAFYEDGSLKRLCLSKEGYQSLEEECNLKEDQTCRMTMAMCEQSRCMASLPDPTQAFLCPVCKGSGKDFADSKRNCDLYMTIEPCPEKITDAVCAAFGEDGKFERKCLSRGKYQSLMEECDDGESPGCRIAMCEKSRCEASV